MRPEPGRERGRWQLRRSRLRPVHVRPGGERDAEGDADRKQEPADRVSGPGEREAPTPTPAQTTVANAIAAASPIASVLRSRRPRDVRARRARRSETPGALAAGATLQGSSTLRHRRTLPHSSHRDRVSLPIGCLVATVSSIPSRPSSVACAGRCCPFARVSSPAFRDRYGRARCAARCAQVGSTRTAAPSARRASPPASPAAPLPAHPRSQRRRRTRRVA